MLTRHCSPISTHVFTQSLTKLSFSAPAITSTPSTICPNFAIRVFFEWTGIIIHPDRPQTIRHTLIPAHRNIGKLERPLSASKSINYPPPRPLSASKSINYPPPHSLSNHKHPATTHERDRYEPLSTGHKSSAMNQKAASKQSHDLLRGRTSSISFKRASPISTKDFSISSRTSRHSGRSSPPAMCDSKTRFNHPSSPSSVSSHNDKLSGESQLPGKHARDAATILRLQQILTSLETQQTSLKLQNQPTIDETQRQLQSVAKWLTNLASQETARLHQLRKTAKTVDLMRKRSENTDLLTAEMSNKLEISLRNL